LGGQFQIKAPEPKRPACAELLTRINARLGLGHFDLDFNDGEIGFRTVVPVARKSRLRQSVIEDVIRGHHIIVNDFIPSISAVLFAAQTPEKALAAGQSHQKNGVILRRSDARRAQVAGIAQPKNPVECRNDVRSCLMILPGLTGSFDSVPPRLRPRSTALRMTSFFDAIALALAGEAEPDNSPAPTPRFSLN
jgi:hypothetical protein